MANVAFVTDSASDLDPAVAKAAGIRIVPLSVTFGNESFRAGVDLSTEEFWTRMTAPNAPFPKTAATGPGDFKAVYDEAFAAGADAIVAIHVSHKLSGAMKSAELAAGMLPDREIHIVDSQGASMAQGILAFMGLEMAKLGVSAEEIGRVLNDRASDLRMYVSLETLEYLKKGGRISGTQAAIGTLLSVRADHRGGGRGRRNRRQTPDSGEVEGALHRAHLRPADRTPRDPAHDGARHRRVQRRGDSPLRRGPVVGRGLDRRRIGRAASWSRLRRRGGPLQAVDRPVIGPWIGSGRGATQCRNGPATSGTNGCGTVAMTLRYGGHTRPDRASSGYTRR